MNTQYKDGVFGELTYKRAWIGVTTITWGGSNIQVKLKLSAATAEQLPSEFQKNSYAKAKTADVLQQCIKSLQGFCNKNYNVNLNDSDIIEKLIPKTLIFAQSDYWGILFKCPWEDEILLAVKFEGASIEAGVDDILL